MGTNTATVELTSVKKERKPNRGKMKIQLFVVLISVAVVLSQSSSTKAPTTASKATSTTKAPTTTSKATSTTQAPTTASKATSTTKAPTTASKATSTTGSNKPPTTTNNPPATTSGASSYGAVAIS